MINIKVGDKANQPDEPAVTKAVLQIRKGLDGSLMIGDHENVDIVVIPSKSKILLLAKDIMDDAATATQARFFRYMTRKGIVAPDSVHAGNVYASMSGTIPETEENVNPIDFALLVISRWIEDERPHFLYTKAAEQERVEDLTDPDDDESTELGEVPHAAMKGSMKPGVRPTNAQVPYLSEQDKS